MDRKVFDVRDLFFKFVFLQPRRVPNIKQHVVNAPKRNKECEYRNTYKHQEY